MNLGLWTPFPALLHVLHTPLHLVRAGWHSWSGEVAWKQGSPSTVTRPSPLPVCWARLGLPWWVKRVWRGAALCLGLCFALTHKVRVREKGGSLSVTGAIWRHSHLGMVHLGSLPAAGAQTVAWLGTGAGISELGHRSWGTVPLFELAQGPPLLSPYGIRGSRPISLPSPGRRQRAWPEDRRCSF